MSDVAGAVNGSDDSMCSTEYVGSAESTVVMCEISNADTDSDQDEVDDLGGLSKEQVSQTAINGLKKLEKHLKSHTTTWQLQTYSSKTIPYIRY